MQERSEDGPANASGVCYAEETVRGVEARTVVRPDAGPLDADAPKRSDGHGTGWGAGPN